MKWKVLQIKGQSLIKKQTCKYLVNLSNISVQKELSECSSLELKISSQWIRRCQTEKQTIWIRKMLKEEIKTNNNCRIQRMFRVQKMHLMLLVEIFSLNWLNLVWNMILYQMTICSLIVMRLANTASSLPLFKL